MRRTLALLLFALVVFSGCSRTADAKRYQLHGQIVRVDPQFHVLAIKHSRIEGWMEAMTMEYPVKDTAYFQTLHTGDRITGTVFVRDLDYWIDEIHPETTQQK